MIYVLYHGPFSLHLTDYSLNDVHTCVNYDFKVGGTIKKVYAELGVSVEKCKNILNEIKGRW